MSIWVAAGGDIDGVDGAGFMRCDKLWIKEGKRPSKDGRRQSIKWISGALSVCMPMAGDATKTKKNLDSSLLSFT